MCSSGKTCTLADMEILKNNAGGLCPEFFQTSVIDYIANRKFKWLQYCQNWLPYIVRESMCKYMVELI